MTEPVDSRHTDAQGYSLARYDWPLAPGQPARGAVLLVHGLGEHAGRHDALARRLNRWGYAVCAYDQFGHGGSAGLPGALPTDTQLLDDLADMVEHLRAHRPAGQPLILLGHSLGGLVAARLVAQGRPPVDALVLSSPALDPGLSPWQRLLVATLPRLLPDLRVGNGLNPDFLSHDPAVVQAYRADPLVHDRISARLARFIAEAGPAVVAQAPAWRVPTLLLYAGDDRLVNPAGSRAFAAAAPPGVVTARCFEDDWHEIFHETGREAVYAELRTWLDARCPAA